MKAFTYVSFPSRVVFGAGSVARLPQEVEKLGAKRALVISTPGRAADVKRLAATLGGLVRQGSEARAARSRRGCAARRESSACGLLRGRRWRLDHRSW
jgi:hypothetical protein